jgi:hypothetical protein
MTDNDWIKQLQAKMDGHKEPVPDGLWHDIEAQLPQQSKVKPVWRRYAAAAAIALAVIGTGSLLWNRGEDTSVDTPAITLSQDEEHTPRTEVLTENDVTSPADDEIVISHHIAHAVPVNHSSATAAANDTPKAVSQTTNDSEPEKKEEKASQTIPPEEVPKDSQPTLALIDDNPIQPSSANSGIQRLPRKKEPITIGLFASNSVITPKLESTGLYMVHPMSDVYDTPISIYSYTKHYKPVTLGASVRVPISGRWSVTSGLTYSRLKSKTTIMNSYQEQVLHYVGVPLGAIYTVWNYKHFNVYAIGGIQADFNVKATLKKSTQVDVTSIGKDRVQFSALAGPGLQFDLLQGFGIYVEPTARYYFNNGSAVDNYFKDKPWNINLNAGLRLSL